MFAESLDNLLFKSSGISLRFLLEVLHACDGWLMAIYFIYFKLIG